MLYVSLRLRRGQGLPGYFPLSIPFAQTEFYTLNKLPIIGEARVPRIYMARNLQY